MVIIKARSTEEHVDLVCIPIVEKYDEHSLPFKLMPRRINDTHRYGLEIED